VHAETWISVDVETSGPTPASGSLLAIGACLVDSPEEGIELLLRPDPGLPWREDAEAVHHLSRDRLAREGLEPGRAMELLAEWVERHVPPGGRPVFVAFNAPFDWMFVADYFWRFLGHNPFGISALDLKAYYMSRADVAEWEHTHRQNVDAYLGMAPNHNHHALDDARGQALLAQRLLSRPATGG
jgi:DNA polymerase III epsilon subunit-like protein